MEEDDLKKGDKVFLRNGEFAFRTGVVEDIILSNISSGRMNAYVVRFDKNSVTTDFRKNLWKLNKKGENPDDSSESEEDSSESEESENDVVSLDMNVSTEVAAVVNIVEPTAAGGNGGGAQLVSNPPQSAVTGGIKRGRGKRTSKKTKNDGSSKVVPVDPHVVDGNNWEDADKISENIEKFSCYAGRFHLNKPHWIRELETFGVNTPFHYFLFLFPFEQLYKTQQATAANWSDSEFKTPPTVGQIVAFLGIMLAMALDPIKGSRKDYWKVPSLHDKSSITARNYGVRFGMSRNFFEAINKHLVLDFYTAADLKQDPWKQVRSLVDAFNANRYKTVEPGRIICVDEIMSQWEGKPFKYHPEGCPHITKMPRKPVSSGIEGKCSCDGESGIMLYIEIQEGQKAMGLKPFTNDYQAHTATVLRCVSNWFHSKRIIVGDAWFGSVSTASACLKHRMHFIGVVKQVTKGYPKAIFEMWEGTNPQRGKTCFLTTKINVDGEQHVLMAADWMTKKGKRIISTCSNGLPGKPYVKTRTKVVESPEGVRESTKYDVVTERSQVFEELFRSFSVIDVHDHYRQGILELERHWKTNVWWHRFFITILGIVYTDCFFAYRKDFLAYGDIRREFLEYEDFLDQLSSSMIFNDLDTFGTHEYGQRRETAEDKRDITTVTDHSLLLLSETPHFIELKAKSLNPNSFRARLRCVSCREPCSHYCQNCTVGDKFVAVHNADHKDSQGCLLKHIEDAKSQKNRRLL